MAHLKIRPFSDTDLHQEEIRQAVYEEAPKNGFWYPAVSHAGQKLKKGTLLGTLKDIYGNEIFRCTAPFDGVVLYYNIIFILQALGSLTNTRWRALLSAIADGLFVKDARKTNAA